MVTNLSLVTENEYERSAVDTKIEIMNFKKGFNYVRYVLLLVHKTKYNIFMVLVYS